MVASNGRFCRSWTISNVYGVVCNSTARGNFDSVYISDPNEDNTFRLSLSPASSVPTTKLVDAQAVVQ